MDQHCESCCAVSHSLLVTRSEPQETEQMQTSMNASAYKFQSLLDACGQENQVGQVNVQLTEHNRYKNMLQSVELKCVTHCVVTPTPQQGPVQNLIFAIATM